MISHSAQKRLNISLTKTTGMDAKDGAGRSDCPATTSVAETNPSARSAGTNHAE